ncbi:hypothetical protein ACJX0J_017473, partial [Zea mays]
LENVRSTLYFCWTFGSPYRPFSAATCTAHIRAPLKQRKNEGLLNGLYDPFTSYFDIFFGV